MWNIVPDIRYVSLLSLNSPLNAPLVEEYIKIGEAREGFVIKILHYFEFERSIVGTQKSAKNAQNFKIN